MASIEADLWPSPTMPSIRCGTGVLLGLWHSVDGQVCTWDSLNLLAPNRPEQFLLSEVDVFGPRLNDLWPMQEVRDDILRRIASEHHSEVALDTADAAIALGDALIQRLINRLTSRICIAEALLDFFFPDDWRGWRFSARPDIEWAIRALPMIGLVTREWLDRALRWAFGDTAVLSISESVLHDGPDLCARIQRTQAGNTMVAFPPLVGNWPLGSPVVQIVLDSSCMADGATLLGYEDDSSDPQKTYRCAYNIAAEFVPPHSKIEIEVTR